VTVAPVPGVVVAVEFVTEVTFAIIRGRLYNTASICPSLSQELILVLHSLQPGILHYSQRSLRVFLYPSSQTWQKLEFPGWHVLQFKIEQILSQAKDDYTRAPG
jgi:hypothetical protein